jgi:hypothetical protein
MKRGERATFWLMALGFIRRSYPGNYKEWLKPHHWYFGNDEGQDKVHQEKGSEKNVLVKRQFYIERTIRDYLVGHPWLEVWLDIFIELIQHNPLPFTNEEDEKKLIELMVRP